MKKKWIFRSLLYKPTRTFLDCVKLRDNKENWKAETQVKHSFQVFFTLLLKIKINKDKNKTNKNILRGCARQSSTEQLMFDLSDETFDEKG